MKAQDIVRVVRLLRKKYRKSIPLSEWVKGDRKLLGPRTGKRS